MISLQGAKRSAAFYGAEFLALSNAGHNLMMEANQAETTTKIEARSRSGSSRSTLARRVLPLNQRRLSPRNS